MPRMQNVTHVPTELWEFGPTTFLHLSNTPCLILPKGNLAQGGARFDGGKGLRLDWQAAESDLESANHPGFLPGVRATSRWASDSRQHVLESPSLNCLGTQPENAD